MNKTIFAAIAIALTVPVGTAYAEDMNDNAMSSGNAMSQDPAHQEMSSQDVAADDNATMNDDMSDPAMESDSMSDNDMSKDDMSHSDMKHDKKMHSANGHDNNGLRPQKSDSGVKYITGGVGDKSQKMLEKHADQYSLHLATVSGDAYVSNVHIQVMNADNETVLDTMADAPMLYADLEPGTYVVKATLNDQSETRKVTVADSGSETVRLSFPSADK